MRRVPPTGIEVRPATDLVFYGGDGEVRCFKVPSTPARPGASILEGIDEIRSALGLDEAAWRELIHTHSSTVATNALGTLRVTQAFVPHLLKGSASRIVNVSSGAGQLSDMGTWSPAYSISKTTLNAITCMFAAALKDKAIAVNSVCPGWCRTEMGGPSAPRSVEQGADGIVWLAADAPQEKTGLFWRDKEIIPW